MNILVEWSYSSFYSISVLKSTKDSPYQNTSHLSCQLIAYKTARPNPHPNDEQRCYACATTSSTQHTHQHHAHFVHICNNYYYYITHSAKPLRWVQSFQFYLFVVSNGDKQSSAAKRIEHWSREDDIYYFFYIFVKLSLSIYLSITQSLFISER